MIAGKEKLVRYLDYDTPVPPFELFDLAADGYETEHLEEKRRRVTASLDAYRRHMAPAPAAAPARVTIDETVERQLRALGYIR